MARINAPPKARIHISTKSNSPRQKPLATRGRSIHRVMTRSYKFGIQKACARLLLTFAGEIYVFNVSRSGAVAVVLPFAARSRNISAWHTASCGLYRHPEAWRKSVSAVPPRQRDPADGLP